VISGMRQGWSGLRIMGRNTVVGSVRFGGRDIRSPAARAAARRWLATPAKEEQGKAEVPAGPDPTQLIQKSKEAADQVKALGGRSWHQWYQEHQDELLVVLLSSLFLLSTLRLYRTRGESLDDAKEHAKKVAELEAKIERLKVEIKASVEGGADKVAAEGGVWSSKVPAMRGAMLKLVDAGIAKATKPVKEEVEEESFFVVTPDAKPEQRQAPVKPKGII